MKLKRTFALSALILAMGLPAYAQEIQQEIETFEAPSSLLSPTAEPEPTEETNSLLARG